MKHSDEIFFWFTEKEVHHLGRGEARWELCPAEPSSGFLLPGLPRSGVAFEMVCNSPEAPDFSGPASLKVPLGSIAHVDRLLGFKGNYAIFPLKDCSHLTGYMLSEFIDDYLGLRDPARNLGVGSSEMLDYARAIWARADLSADDRAALKRVVALTDPNEDLREIILPTVQIYMEALKGKQTLLEDFKLAHRGMDVVKVQEEIRAEWLENLRKAGRMVKSDPDFDDPDADEQIVVHGSIDLDID